MKVREHVIEATWSSVAHWLDNWERCKAKKAFSISSRYCSLCELFNEKTIYYDFETGVDCVGCPVYTVTNKQYCEDTPFGTVNRILMARIWETSDFDPSMEFHHKKLLAAVEAEAFYDGYRVRSRT